MLLKKSLFADFRDLQVLVVGDAMLDEYVRGDVHRISPEAPVPVVQVEGESYTAGGAANVALNLVALGARASLCCWTGRDAAGERLREILQRTGVEYDLRFSRPESPTIVKTRVVVRNQQLCRLDREAGPAAYALHGTPALDWIVEKFAEADAVIFSDYAKGTLDTVGLRALSRAARRRQVFTALDPKPRRALQVAGIDLLTPNRAEALEMAGRSTDARLGAPLWPEICRNLHQVYKPRYLAVTLGAEGMLLSAAGRTPTQIPTYAREVFDVSGAGDTVVAALTLALAAGATFAEAAHLANTAAGVVVAKFGTATAIPEEILSYHTKHPET